LYTAFNASFFLIFIYFILAPIDHIDSVEIVFIFFDLRVRSYKLAASAFGIMTHLVYRIRELQQRWLNDH